MLKNFEQQEEELINMIYTDPKINDVIYLIQEYVNAPTDTNKKDLNKISSEKYNELSNRIYDNLKITLDHNLTHLLSVNQIYFFRTMEIEEYKKYQSTEEYKIYDEFIAPIPYRINDLHFPIVAKEILNYKNIDEINHYDILIKSLDSAIKYLHKVQADFNLDTETMNYFKHGLFREICRITQGIFNKAEYIEFNKNVKEILSTLHQINKSFFNLDTQGELKERIHQDIRLQQCKLETITSNYNDKIIGFNEVDIIYNITPNNIEFNINELKAIIKSYFNTGYKTDNEKQLEYGLWIMYLKANKESDTLPIEDKFILKNMILPWSKDLRELLGEDFDNTNFNIEEAINYINRLKTQGEYKNKYFKARALKKVFNFGANNEELSITEYKYRDKLTSDYSDRMNSILKVLKKHGTKDNPCIEEKNGFTVYKNGNALDDSDIELFYYLIGELEEHGCEQVITFRRSDLINNMGYNSLRGHKLDNLTSSLMNLNAQAIAIIDNREDKVGKKLGKVNFKKFKGTQLLRADIIGDGDEVLIKFTSPFSKYFREQKQFGRLLNREIINKYLFTNPRVVKIARELSRMLYISNQRSKKVIKNIEINYETLIKNIGEWDKYNTHSNKRVYLSRLTDDIEKAINSIESNIKHELIKPTPKTIKNGKIKLLKK